MDNTQGFFQFRLGNMDLLVVSDGQVVQPGVQPLFAPGVPAAEVEQFLHDNFYATDAVTFAGNVLVIKQDHRIILIDTGTGTLMPDTGKIVKHLAAAGIDRADITDIVLTHAHPDHIGGTLYKDGTRVFPQAKYYIAQVEYDFWMADQPDFSKGTHNEIADFEISFAQQHLRALQGDLVFFNDGDQLFDILTLQLAPGHTPGHTIVIIDAAGERLVHFADTFQHILVMAHPEWGNQIDSDFEEAVITRKQLGTAWAAERVLTFGNHFPYPGIGFIREKGQGFEWVPKPVFMP